MSGKKAAHSRDFYNKIVIRHADVGVVAIPIIWHSSGVARPSGTDRAK